MPEKTQYICSILHDHDMTIQWKFTILHQKMRFLTSENIMYGTRWLCFKTDEKKLIRLTWCWKGRCHYWKIGKLPRRQLFFLHLQAQTQLRVSENLRPLAYIYTHTYTYTYIYIYIFTCTYIYIYILYIYIYVLHIYMCVYYIHICIYIYICMYSYMYLWRISVHLKSRHIMLFTNEFKCMSIHVANHFLLIGTYLDRRTALSLGVCHICIYVHTCFVYSERERERELLYLYI